MQQPTAEGCVQASVHEPVPGIVVGGVTDTATSLVLHRLGIPNDARLYGMSGQILTLEAA